MKKSLLALLGLLVLVLLPTTQATEIMRWQRLPLSVPLLVGQERIVFVDKNVRVGVPASAAGRLRVQSAGGAVYLRASEPMAPTRIQLQDADTGALILLDISARVATADEPALEPIRIMEGEATRDDAITPPPRQTPIAVVLTRFAAQNLYAPLRTIEPVPGIQRVTLRRELNLETLLPTLPVHATPLAAWRLEDQWVTAVRLTNTSDTSVHLDPRLLQGDFLTATFQHHTLGVHGTPEDTTVVYLVTRDHGLAQSLLPAIQRFDPAVHLNHKEPDDAQ